MKLPNTTERIILGIDPGTTIMGYGVIRVIGQKAEMITLGSVDLHKLKDHYLTLKEVFNAVTASIAHFCQRKEIQLPFHQVNIFQSMQ